MLEERCSGNFLRLSKSNSFLNLSSLEAEDAGLSVLVMFPTSMLSKDVSVVFDMLKALREQWRALNATSNNSAFTSSTYSSESRIWYFASTKTPAKKSLFENKDFSVFSIALRISKASEVCFPCSVCFKEHHFFIKTSEVKSSA